MFDRLRHRSDELEHIDIGDYAPEEYEGCLRELRRVNRLLGDERALRSSLFNDVERSGRESFSVLDVGAGSGHLLRVTAKWARKRGKEARLIGVELNARAAQAIHEGARDFAEIEAVRADARALPFSDGAFDYAICSLFIHHFRDEECVGVLSEMARVARKIFVIDLNRHWLAYGLFVTAGRIFLHNRLVREDGALSIRRGFRHDELLALAKGANLKAIEIRRSFPFRFVLCALSS